jgi:hypothetical protein
LLLAVELIFVEKLRKLVNLGCWLHHQLEIERPLDGRGMLDRPENLVDHGDL